mgnify:CR=1 FL=1
MSITRDTQLDAWIDQHFDEQVKLLQELVRVPTDSDRKSTRLNSSH